MNTTAQGWAVVDSFGYPKIKTVSDTRRAAIVNWLVTDCEVMVFNGDTDGQIERTWQRLRASHNVVPVTVSSSSKEGG